MAFTKSTFQMIGKLFPCVEIVTVSLQYITCRLSHERVPSSDRERLAGHLCYCHSLLKLFRLSSARVRSLIKHAIPGKDGAEEQVNFMEAGSYFG